MMVVSVCKELSCVLVKSKNKEVKMVPMVIIVNE